MKKIVIILSILSVLILSGCKIVGKAEIDVIWGKGVRVKSSNKSSLFVRGHIKSLNPAIELKFDAWSFKIYDSGNNLILDFNNSNYKDFDFEVNAIFPSDRYGRRGVEIGVPDNLFYTYVDVDIYNGMVPTKMVFSCVLKDTNGNLIDVSGERELPFDERDSE